MFIGPSQESEKKEVKEEDYPTLEEAALAARGIKTTGKSTSLTAPLLRFLNITLIIALVVLFIDFLIYF